jgi:hypothetical protein
VENLVGLLGIVPLQRLPNLFLPRMPGLNAHLCVTLPAIYSLPAMRSALPSTASAVCVT